MLSRDYRDVVGGVLLVVFGLAFSRYAVAHYDLGTLQRMGSGMFPVALGVLLTAFGLIIAALAMFRQGKMPEVRFWTPFFVLSGVAAFAVMIRPFGLIPAVLAVTIISSFAELQVRPFSLAVLCATLCLIAWLTFGVGLGLSTPMARWPF